METEEQQAVSFIQQINNDISHGRLNHQQAEQLRLFAERYPCNREITIWLLVAAYTHKDKPEQLGFAEWPTYFQQALARKDTCWSDEDLAHIYRTAAGIYDSDDTENTTLTLQRARECIQAAYDLSPRDWDILNDYIWIMRPGADKRLELAEQQLSLAPDNVWARLRYAEHMYVLVQDKGRMEFIEKARWGFKEFLKGGFEATHPNTIKRIRGQLAYLDELSRKDEGNA